MALVLGTTAALFVVLLVVFVFAMRGRWDLLALHMSDIVREAVAIVLIVGTSVGTLWFYSFGKVVLGNGAEVLINSGGITVAIEVAALIAAAYIARLDLLILASKGRDREHWTAYRRKVLFWFYATIGCSVVANVVFRVSTYGPGNMDWRTFAFWYTLGSAAFAGCVPVVLINVLLIVLRKLPIQYTQRLQHKAQIGYASTLDIAIKTLNREIRAAALGETFDGERVQKLRTTFAFAAPFLGESAQDISHALMQLLPAQAAGLALPDGGQYFDKNDVQQLWGVPERTAQDWISKCSGARKRAGTRRFEAPASALYQSYGVPSNITKPETKPARRNAQTRDNAQEHTGDAQEETAQTREEAQIQIVDAQSITI